MNFSYFEFVQVLAIAILAVMIIKTVVLLVFAYKHYKRKQTKKSNYTPLVTILSPCYNEEVVLENCVESLVHQTYKKIEVIIINDGSKDRTLAIANKLAKKYHVVKVIDKPNGGKASALNAGIKQAKGEIVVCIDGDTVFRKDTVEQLINSFRQDPTVDVVAGNVKLSNRVNITTNSQSVDYLTQLNLEKRTFDELQCFQVVSGCIGAFRKSALEAVGGYSTDTIVEDMDLTIALVKAGYKVVFNARAISYTEGPQNLKDFMTQRYRWSYGRYEVLNKYKHSLLNFKEGTLGMVGLPYSLLSPFTEIAGSILSFIFLGIAVMSGSVIVYAITFGLFLCAAIGICLFALRIDGYDERLSHSVWIISQALWFGYIINYIDAKAGIYYALGIKTRWNKLERLSGGKVLTE